LLKNKKLKRNVDLGIWHRLSQLVIGLIVIACLLGLGLWYLPEFQKNARMRKKILDLETQIKAEQATQAYYQAVITSIKTDPKTVERLARQKLGYAKPGETIIYFQAPQDPSAPQGVR
jgi:cell division protein FtsB